MTWPTMTFTGRMTLWLGKLEVQLIQLGRGHTKGDTVVWLPQDKVLFSGDLVEFDATPYAGDAYFQDWPKTLDNIAALKPAGAGAGPRRGAAGRGRQVAAGLEGTRAFVSELYASVKAGAAAGKDLRAVYKRDLRQAAAQVRPVGHLRPLHALRRDPRLRRGHAATPTRASGPPSATSRCGKPWRPETMKIERIHHVAYRCRDAKETVEWYRKHLGMDFVLAIAEDQVPSTHAPDPYMHLFLDAGNGNMLAFFELPNSPPMGRDTNTPDWVQHIAFKVEQRAGAGGHQGAARGRRHRGGRRHRPHDLQVDLLLRPQRPPPRTGLPTPPRPTCTRSSTT